MGMLLMVGHLCGYGCALFLLTVGHVCGYAPYGGTPVWVWVCLIPPDSGTHVWVCSLWWDTCVGMGVPNSS